MNNSKIEWTDYTFNPWWGCTKVSTGCKNCYAEAQDKRWNKEQPHWGPNSTRKSMSDSYWEEPRKWNIAAMQSGVKAKVFCASMADVFEAHPDTLHHLTRLFNLIAQTPYLIWQLLTKRPENIKTLVPSHWLKQWPANVWIGTSVEDQEAANERIPPLLQLTGNPIRFISCEPLLEKIDFILKKKIGPSDKWEKSHDVLKGWEYCKDLGSHGPTNKIDWVIVGGESGLQARPMHPDWALSIRDQCKEANVSFFFKQWGEWCPYKWPDGRAGSLGTFIEGSEFKVGNFILDIKGQRMIRVGKKRSGNLLADSEYKEFPRVNYNLFSAEYHVKMTLTPYMENVVRTTLDINAEMLQANVEYTSDGRVIYDLNLPPEKFNSVKEFVAKRLLSF